ncbi:MAG: Bax inhibitor-1/YccA family protein, partial [Candidatus Omnitrophica bacterium]|nr:Bax inhibitor-1/YccA family protein [Candidatus Omnitrophota bacterium]
GICLKSFFCILLLTIGTLFIWHLFSKNIDIKWYTSGGMLCAILVSIIISLKQHWAYFLVPIYAITKGLLVRNVNRVALL